MRLQAQAGWRGRMSVMEAAAAGQVRSAGDLAAAARAARAASRELAHRSSAERRAGLEAMAACLSDAATEVLEANGRDVAAARAAGVAESMCDRLTLDERRLRAVAEALRTAATLPDPLNRVLEGRTLPNGLRLQRRSVPLGVLGIIYEARPNVTVDAA